MSGIIQRKMGQDQDFARQVKDAQATKPVISITPEGQQVEIPYSPRPFEAERHAHLGQIVTYYHRKGAHIANQLSHPAMIMGWSADGLADLLVFTGAREGDWVQRWAGRRSERDPWGTWEFCEPESESPYKLMEIITGLSRRLTDLALRMDALEAGATGATTAIEAPPRPPGTKGRH